MKFTVENIVYLPSEIDIDKINIEFDVHFTEPEDMWISYFCNFSELLEYVEKVHPAFYAYYKKTNLSLDKWGPAEKQTLEAMGEEAVEQFHEFLKEFIPTTEIPKWTCDMGLQRKNRSPEDYEKNAKLLEEFEEISDDLTDGFNEIRDLYARKRTFCEKADRKMRELALEIFPELSNLDPEDLKEFRYFFVDEIKDMSFRLDLLLELD